MKKIVVLLFLVSLVFPVLSQQSQQRDVGPFSGVKVAEGIDVYLKKGDKESVRVEVTGTNLENVLTEISGTYLKIHMATGTRGRVQVSVYVTYVKINKLSASSAGNIFAEEPIRTNAMEMQCSSAGNIEVALEAGSLEVSASSAGQVEVRGKVKFLEADASSAAQINAYDLEADKVDVDASSAGSVKVHVISAFDADASSGGSIRYRGNPSRSETNSSSGGSVKKSG